MISYYKKKNYKLKKLDLRNSKKIILGVESNEAIKCFNIRMIIFNQFFCSRKKNINLCTLVHLYLQKNVHAKRKRTLRYLKQ